VFFDVCGDDFEDEGRDYEKVKASGFYFSASLLH
jgi:hypothetical protein